MVKRKEKPVIMFRKTARGPVPETAFDAEEWDALPMESTVSVTPATVRGHGQLAFYWTVLAHVVDATGRWPSKEKLHEMVKLDLGYVELTYTLAGGPRVTADSIALDKMDDNERAAFMKQAFERIGEAIGIDPIAFLEQARAA